MGVCMAAYALYAAGVIILAANRITGVFLVIAYWLVMWGQLTRARITWGVLYALLWGVVTAAVRWWVGSGENPHTLTYIWQYNLGTWGASVFALIALLSAWWLLLPRAIWQSRGYVTRLLILVLVYMVPFAVFGVWHETRLLLWVVPIAIAAILQAEQRGKHESNTHRL